MTITIPDDVMRDAGLTEQDALVEIACRLFDAGRLHKAPAARMAGLSRADFEGALLARGLPVLRFTEEHLQQDLESLKRLGM